VLVAKVGDGRNRSSDWKLIGRILTTLTYVIAIVVASAIVLAIAYTITQFEIQHLDLLRRHLPLRQ
jgi:hypothetical protein